MAIRSKKEKISARARTKFRIRRKISGTEDRPRISVFKSSKHTYAQLISDVTNQTLASASTLDEEVQSKIADVAPAESTNGSKSLKSAHAARVVGLVLAERAKQKQIASVVFDRNGFKYFGRIKAIADGAREGGLEF